jgi:hypothetical protein
MLLPENKARVKGHEGACARAIFTALCY